MTNDWKIEAPEDHSGEIERLRTERDRLRARIAELEAAGNRLGDAAIGAILDNMEANTTPMNGDESGAVIGYMCRIDFECELGVALGGNTIYPDIEDCREKRKCTDICGIVEVEVRCRRIVHAGPDNE